MLTEDEKMYEKEKDAKLGEWIKRFDHSRLDMYQEDTDDVTLTVKRDDIMWILVLLHDYLAERGRHTIMNGYCRCLMHINNAPDFVCQYTVCRQDDDGELWYYGSYDDENRARLAVRELSNGVLLNVIVNDIERIVLKEIEKKKGKGDEGW